MNAGFDLAEARALLARTPGALRAWLGGLPDAWTRAVEAPGTWSAYDIVGHLVDGERHDWIPRARIILEHGTARPFELFDRERHRSRPDETLLARLDELAVLRRDNLAALDALAIGPGQLERRGVHPRFGEVTLEQLLATWVAHDLDHLYHVARIMARRYTDATGPWIEYLRVLRPGAS